jgi:protocatechuate 4,5-dioxygenase alpha chain
MAIVVTNIPRVSTESERPVSVDKRYTDIPGTVVFDAEQSRKGYWLNMFCMSLMKAQNRERFRADERACLDEWPMSEEQKQAVLARDCNRMIAFGGNIFFIAKIFATYGQSFQYVAALMTGMSQEDYARMMLNGGRAPGDFRCVAERADG